VSEEFIDLATLRLLNESAIRDHALACSKAYRAGKFTRVGQEFIDEVKADTEALVRELRSKYQTLHPVLDPGNKGFTTGALSDRIMHELNHVIGRMVQNKVQKQPSCGCTLSRTR
jgi:hypothetical protein